MIERGYRSTSRCAGKSTAAPLAILVALTLAVLALSTIAQRSGRSEYRILKERSRRNRAIKFAERPSPSWL